MTTVATVKKKDTLYINCGMGIFQVSTDWLPAIGHSGGLHSYSSNVLWFPGQKVTIVAPTNPWHGGM
jgi:hypothetical protein